MRETRVVSSRGRITLPAEMRKQLGIKAGSILMFEIRGEVLVFKPAAVLDTYSDHQIAEWDKADALSPEERRRILRRLRAAD